MNVTLIIVCVIFVVLNIVIYPLCKPRYREEDAVRIAEGTLRVKSQWKVFPALSWIFGALVLFFVLSGLDERGTTMIGIFCVLTVIFCAIGMFLRRSYYTMDEDRLTYVKHGEVAWSHTWDEIDHARRRFISTGKSVVMVYDIVTKDGVKHYSLPSSLGKELKSHVYMDNRLPTRAKWVLGILLVLLLAMLLINWLR